MFCSVHSLQKRGKVSRKGKVCNAQSRPVILQTWKSWTNYNFRGRKEREGLLTLLSPRILYTPSLIRVFLQSSWWRRQRNNWLRDKSLYNQHFCLSCCTQFTCMSSSIRRHSSRLYLVWLLFNKSFLSQLVLPSNERSHSCHRLMAFPVTICQNDTFKEMKDKNLI